MSDIVPRSQLTKQGVQGVVAVAGGIGVLVLASLGWFGAIIGGVVTVIGIALAGGKKERMAGIAMSVLGGVTVVSSIFNHGFFHGIMIAAGILLIGLGGFSLFRFFSNLRKRT
jgi:hypothetical protein